MRLVDPYRVTVSEYVSFRRDGYLIARGLVLGEHVAEISTHCDDLFAGRVAWEGFAVDPKASDDERDKQLLRVHMGHLHHELWERYLLYPRVLDVVEALMGPDVLALQTMLFRKGPGSNGQGFHQDSFYIPTFPDTLVGAWIAIDRADEENGCLWVGAGSQNEPIYPPESGYGYGDAGLEGIPHVRNVGGHQNDDSDPENTLRPMAMHYAETPVVLDPGDVVFFGGHLFHRSLKNRSAGRTRRALVNHYCNARSFTTWGGGNTAHILARGNSHLPFAKPKFGTPCAALDTKLSPSDRGASPDMMMGMPDGTMGKGPAGD
jgi:hypothetical protein